MISFLQLSKLNVTGANTKLLKLADSSAMLPPPPKKITSLRFASLIQMAPTLEGLEGPLETTVGLRLPLFMVGKPARNTTHCRGSLFDTYLAVAQINVPK